jgi:hypothetical protein
MPFHVHMRFSGMAYPLAWQALIDSTASSLVGRFVEEERCRYFEEPYGLYEGRVLMTGLCTVFSGEWLRSDDLERRADLP